MGNWNITIRGVGAHHNKKLAHDANRMAAEFVQMLKDAGHSVVSATFTHGGEDYLGAGRGYLDTRDEIEAG
jgi:hypothetical protein